MSPGDDGGYKFVARPVRHGEHDAAPLGKSIVENADRLIELDLVQDRRGRNSAMKGRQ
jgi:hypothetical protein